MYKPYMSKPQIIRSKRNMLSQMTIFNPKLGYKHSFTALIL